MTLTVASALIRIICASIFQQFCTRPRYHAMNTKNRATKVPEILTVALLFGILDLRFNFDKINFVHIYIKENSKIISKQFWTTLFLFLTPLSTE